VLFSKAALATFAARAADAVELLESAKPLAAGDDQLSARILQLEAQNLVQLRMYQRASQVVDEALLSAEHTGDPYLAAQARLAAGYLALSTLDMPRAAKEFAFAVSAPGDLHQQMAAASRRAIALSCIGELEEAARQSAGAIAYFQRMVDGGGEPGESDPYECGIASLAASLPAIARGRFDDALSMLAGALASAGNPPNAGVVRMLLPLVVQAHHAAGRFAEADECIAHYLLREEDSARTPVFARIYDVLSSAARGGEASAITLPSPPPRMPDLQSLPVSVLAAEAAVATRDAAAGARQIDAIRHLHETGMVFTTGWVALVPRLLGALHLLCGDVPRARDCLDLAMKKAEAVGAWPEVGLTHLEMAYLDAAQGPEQFASAGTHLAEARRLLTGCGIRAHDRRLAELSGVVGASAGLPDSLTDEDTDFLRMIAAGLSNRRIASERALSVHAVQRRIGQLYRKIGVGDRRGATAYAYRNGIARDGA
jgi:DNA-binding CsgD family transcriptional regulator/tetratricopeptide (TPR) repeat protein